MKRLIRGLAVGLMVGGLPMFGGGITPVHASGGPVVTSVSPNVGPISGGTSVTITGIGFTNATHVAFLGGGILDWARFVVVSDTEITATSPSKDSGVVDDIQVEVSGGGSALTSADQFTYGFTPPPPPSTVITSLSPTSGPIFSGGVITISGSGLSGTTEVEFSGVYAGTFTVVNDNTITLTPASQFGAPRTVDVTVITPHGNSAVNGADHYTLMPEVDSVGPNSGPATGGSPNAPMTITGHGFVGVTAVTFGGTPATSYTVTGENSMSAVAPAGSGQVDIQVTASGLQSPAVAADRYTYNPVTYTVAPVGGPLAGGTDVVLTGVGLTGTTGVTFNGVAASGVVVVGDTQVTAVAPAGTAGWASVDIIQPSGTIPTTGYEYYALASVTVAPSSGTTAGGTPITISGINMAAVTGVKFGSVSVNTVIHNADGSITVISPPGSAGAVPLLLYENTALSPASTIPLPVGGNPGGPWLPLAGAGLLGALALIFRRRLLAPLHGVSLRRRGALAALAMTAILAGASATMSGPSMKLTGGGFGYLGAGTYTYNGPVATPTPMPTATSTPTPAPVVVIPPPAHPPTPNTGTDPWSGWPGVLVMILAMGLFAITFKRRHAHVAVPLFNGEYDNHPHA